MARTLGIGPWGGVRESCIFPVTWSDGVSMDFQKLRNQPVPEHFQPKIFGAAHPRLSRCGDDQTLRAGQTTASRGFWDDSARPTTGIFSWQRGSVEIFRGVRSSRLTTCRRNVRRARHWLAGSCYQRGSALQAVKCLPCAWQQLLWGSVTGAPMKEVDMAWELRT
jgi:hypothetical protein